MKIRLPNLISEDWPRKFTALFFAILIWIAIDRQLHESRVISNVVARFEYDNNNMLLAREYTTVNVTLRGAGERLQQVKPTDLEITVKVPMVEEGVYLYQYNINKSDVRTPLGIRAVRVHQKDRVVTVDRLVQKRDVPIRSPIDGEPRDGYRVTRVTLDEKEIDIRGPSRIVDDIEVMDTEPIVLDDAVTKSFDVDLAIVKSPEITCIDEVRARIEIAKHSSQKAYHDLPMQVLKQEDSELRLEEPLARVSVTLHGPNITLNNLDKLSIRPFVDLSTITSPGTYRRPVQVWVDGAPDVRAQYVHPSVVSVTLTAGPERKETEPEADTVTPPAGTTQPGDVGNDTPAVPEPTP